MNFHNLHRISDYEWEIQKSYRADMLVPVRLFATQRLLEAALEDQSIEQAVNAATLPGLVGPVVVMPDMHQGYGFPIGGVAATRYPDGVISPGAIGYDINCGVRLLSSTIELEQAEPYLDQLAAALDQACPSGVGTKGALSLSDTELDQLCREGARWAYQHGMGTLDDLRRTEESGTLKNADPSQVSKRAKQRGRSQIGTLGSGNHFLEVGVVDEIFDLDAAKVMGLSQGCLTVLIHCGSRGFGHQICTDSVQDFQGAAKRYGIHLRDRELVCAPLNSPEGKAYLGAMQAAANYAFANRQILAHSARQVFIRIFSGIVSDPSLNQVYDIAHNMGKIETHKVEGKQIRVCVHRKGATRSFGPGHADLPEEYQAIGQPVLVPGSMGTESWVLVGSSKSMEISWGSCCHGAGRTLSRSQAKKQVRGEELKRDLAREGILIKAGSLPGLAEEAPSAYKDVNQVVKVVSGAGIACKVARLRPVAVIKG